MDKSEALKSALNNKSLSSHEHLQKGVFSPPLYQDVKPSIPGVELYAYFVNVELYTGPPCSALVSSRVRDLAARQPVYLSLPERAERATKGHTGPIGGQFSMACIQHRWLWHWCLGSDG